MAWTQSIYPMAGKLGIAMRMPSIATRTRLAHEAGAWARAQGQADAMNSAIFRAYFERSADIGNVEVLAGLAAGIGLDAGALRTALTTQSHLQEVIADEEQAERYGLTGVPAFIWNGHGLVGVQTEKSLEQLLSRAV